MEGGRRFIFYVKLSDKNIVTQVPHVVPNSEEVEIFVSGNYFFKIQKLGTT